jgi:formylglycine-generating enzyme required for sulfatase activity
MLSRCCVLAALALLCVQAIGQEDTRGVEVISVDDQADSVGYVNRHALIIGIDEYEDPGYPDLSYAVADAQALAKMLVGNYGFPEDNVRLILNQDATKAAIEEALENCTQAGTDDFVVAFFAGHGLTRHLGGRGQRGYLVPVDGARDRSHNPKWSSLLDMVDLEQSSEAMEAKHALFVLDCCFGGLAVKRAAPPIAAGLSNRARQVISAGSAEQPVLDAGGGGHSVFTASLLDGLQGSADLDGDEVVTFGELFNHVGRSVEQKTENRQTPLQATFPDHEGGSIAFFAPGVKPGGMSAAERLASIEKTAQEQLEEIERLSDALVVRNLKEEADELWPRRPEKVPAYRDWLVRARQLEGRVDQHRASLQHVLQQAHLAEVAAGLVRAGAGDEPDWSRADSRLAWRYETFAQLVIELQDLAGLVADVEERLEVATTIWQRSVGDYQEEWNEAITDIALGSRYHGLEIEPQIGLVPIGPDHRSGLWEFWFVESGEEPLRGDSGELDIDASSGVVLILIPKGTVRPDFFSDFEWAVDLSTPRSVEPFFLGKVEITVGQWERCIGVGDGSIVPDGENGSSAVNSVSWTESKHALDRWELQLPTWSQWLVACQSGTTSPWWNIEIFVEADLSKVERSPYGVLGLVDDIYEMCLDTAPSDIQPANRAEDAATRMKLALGGGVTFSLDDSDHDPVSIGIMTSFIQPDERVHIFGVRPARSIDP